MALIDSSDFAHVRITVTDIARSKEFYDRVFGWPIKADASSKVNEPGVRESRELFYGGVVYQLPSGAVLGLRPVGTEKFDPDRTGLDHLSFKVASKEALVEARQALDDAGVEHGEVQDIGGGLEILSFSDPDGVQLELAAEVGPPTY
jgi:catechol 2,3-dioxygenase-like lactoylglutathione lyase family enzyme